MLTELQRRKLAHMFDLYDDDKDGGLTRGDYEQVSQRVAAVYALQPGTAEYARLVGGLMAQWEFVQQIADSDKDNRVNLPEYQAGWGGLLADKATFAGLVGTYADMSIAFADGDRDGKLTEAEFIANLRGYRVEEADAAASFARLDQDKDGYLTRDELVRATDEFFNSGDPTAPGNWLLGSF